MTYARSEQARPQRRLARGGAFAAYIVKRHVREYVNHKARDCQDVPLLWLPELFRNSNQVATSPLSRASSFSSTSLSKVSTQRLHPTREG